MIYLEPSCTGGCWKAHNLRRIADPTKYNQIFAKERTTEGYTISGMGAGIHVSNPGLTPIEYPEFLTDVKSKESEIKPIFISVPKI